MWILILISIMMGFQLYSVNFKYIFLAYGKKRVHISCLTVARRKTFNILFSTQYQTLNVTNVKNFFIVQETLDLSVFY